MKQFSSLGQFGRFLGTIAAAHIVEQEALENACSQIEERAKDKIGEYQPAAGPFAAWAPLADATKADRLSQGYAEDEPLLRTGEMRDSIEHKVVGNEGHVGSNSDIAMWQELGTVNIPPRSFLGSAAFELGPEIGREIGVEFFAYLAGGGKRIGVR